MQKNYVIYPADAPNENPRKPFRVTAYRAVRGRITRCFIVGDFSYYWQANLISWVYHYVFGFGCNTWKASSESNET
jgi:hypothetical protein